MKSQFSKILTSSPVNRQAALVADGGGETWKPNYKGNPHARKWDAPPACVPIPTEPAALRTFQDFTGHKIGRLTVVGFLGKVNPKTKALWLVKCACGTYETRGSKALKGGMIGRDYCEDCRYLERVKRGDGITSLPTPPNKSNKE